MALFGRKERGTDDPRPGVVRDYLYVDSDRTRVLLAQLERGVVEQVIERSATARRSVVTGAVFGSSISRDVHDEVGSEQARSLQDVLFLIFEEAAEESHLFVDVAEFREVEQWRTGQLHASLSPGQLVRIDGQMQLLDPRHFRSEVDRSLDALEIAVTFGDGPLPQTPGKQQQRAARQLVKNLLGGVDPVQARRMGEFVELYLGSEASVRLFPCGTDHRDAALIGHLLSRPGYLQDEREVLFAKYGSTPSRWTLLAQLASIPSPGTQPGADEDSDGPGKATQDDVDDIEEGGQTSDEEATRVELEQVALDLMRALEETGIVGVPQFPAMSVTPIGIYREVGQPARSLAPDQRPPETGSRQDRPEFPGLLTD